MSLKLLLDLNVPSTKHSEITFFDIAKMPHYEDVITRFYAYFLSDLYVATHGSWLRDALFKLIMEKTGKTLSVKTCRVETQVSLLTRHRLDLVLTVTTTTGEKKGVIIENKIYHHLNNDLQSYWDNSCFDCKEKIGIVLSLTKENVSAFTGYEFVNILHLDVAREVGRKAENITDEANRIYARDFISNLKKLSNMATINDEVKFYFEHAKKVNDAINTRDEAIKYIKSEIIETGETMGLDNFPSEDKSDYIYLCNNAEDDLYYEIHFDQLLNGTKKIKIVIGLSQIARKNVDKFDLVIESSNVGSLEKLNDKQRNYARLLAKTYDLSGEDLNDLSGFLAKNITYDFKPMMNLLRIERLKMNQTLN